MIAEWDVRFLSLARFVAGWSKDPSTKTGAVIVDPKRRVVSLGYNGFARGVRDGMWRLNDREIKYEMMIHCERNAILFAQRPLDGCTLYTWPFASCAPCAAMAIQAGIKRVVAPPCPHDKEGRWLASLMLAREMFLEAGVAYDTMEVV